MIHSIRYSDDMPDNFGGYTKAWFIRIRPKYKDDIGLHNHELCHVWQWWRTFGFHSLLYLISKSYRLKTEVECYKEQLKYAPAIHNPEYYRDMYAGFISEEYNLNISKEEAVKLLK